MPQPLSISLFPLSLEVVCEDFLGVGEGFLDAGFVDGVEFVVISFEDEANFAHGVEEAYEEDCIFGEFLFFTGVGSPVSSSLLFYLVFQVV